jgi:pimeloyl-ACP methyl ester carboxylesterase
MGETMVPANGVDLCLETFGDRGDPPVLLIAGAASSMDWWEDGFCRRLAAGGRFVIRYDHRDTGRSTSFPAGKPPYTHVDMAGDALGVLDALGIPRAHVVGLSLGGGLAQRLAVEDPTRLRSLTLMSTSPGPVEESPPSSSPPSSAAPTGDSPAAPPGESSASSGESSASHGASSGEPSGESSGEPSGEPSGGEETDWADRKVAVDRLVAGVIAFGGRLTAGEPQLRRLAERVFDRTTDMAASQINHWLAEAGPPIRDRLGMITAPTLIMHGTVDPFLSMAHPRALAAEILGARLVPLEGVGHEYPPTAVWDIVIPELLRHTA